MRKTSKLSVLFLGIIFFVLCGFFVFPNNVSADVNYFYITVDCKNSMTGAQVNGCSVSISSNHNSGTDMWYATLGAHTSCDCWTCRGFCSASGVTGSSCSTTPATTCSFGSGYVNFGSSDNAWGFNCDHNQLSATLTAPSGYTLVGNSTVGPFTVSNGQDTSFIWYVTPDSPPSCTVPLYVSFSTSGASPYFLWVDSNSSNLNEGIVYFANGFTDADGDRAGIQKKVPTGNLNPNTNYWLCSKYTGQPLASWILEWYKITTGGCCYEESSCNSWDEVGDTKCVGTNAYTLCGTGTPMGFDDDTCLEWHAPIPCDSDEVCSGGECVSCSCSWTHQGCGEGPCDEDEMYHEQDCSPAACFESWKCVEDTTNCVCTDTAPSAPTLTFPADGATNVSVDADLDWAPNGWGTRCDGDNKSYKLYFEKSSSTPSFLTNRVETNSFYDPGTLLPGTKYYWKVEQCNLNCVSSPVWSFTTEPPPKSPPCSFDTNGDGVPDRGYGDVDADGDIDNADFVYVALHYDSCGPIGDPCRLTGDQRQAADVNISGDINNVDVLAIGRYINDIITTFDVCGTAPFNYSISNSGDLLLVKGTSGTNHIALTLLSGMSQSVNLNVSGIPAGASFSFDPASSCSPTCNSDLKIDTGSANEGDYEITVTGASAGIPNKTTKFNLKIQSPPLSISCSAIPSSSYIGKQIQWKATASGGSGSYNNFFWWGDTGRPKTSCKLKAGVGPNTNPNILEGCTFDTIGNFTARVSVNDGADTEETSCIVYIGFPPLLPTWREIIPP